MGITLMMKGYVDANTMYERMGEVILIKDLDCAF